MLLGSGDGPQPPPKAIGWAFLIGGAAGSISALGVLWKKAWGIPVCAIISAFYLFGFPIGTILGGYFRAVVCIFLNVPLSLTFEACDFAPKSEQF